MAVMVAEKRMAVSGLKIYNILNGGFYILYGLWGVILPSRIAGFMGWDTVTALGVHQIRALWTGLFAIGAAVILHALKTADQRYLTLLIIFGTLALASGRLLGLAIDGPIKQTYFEIGFEIIWAGLGFLLYRCVKA